MSKVKGQGHQGQKMGFGGLHAVYVWKNIFVLVFLDFNIRHCIYCQAVDFNTLLCSSNFIFLFLTTG